MEAKGSIFDCISWRHGRAYPLLHPSPSGLDLGLGSACRCLSSPGWAALVQAWP